MAVKFDLLEKFRRALLRSDGLADGVRNASDADYLVKMNIPPLLGRRDAACDFCCGRSCSTNLKSCR